MINTFLKKYQEELISEKISLKEDMDLLETKINEEEKFLNVLEESNESYFKEFTPRNLNENNLKKADEIRDYLVNLNSQLDKKYEKMKFYDGRLSEIALLLSKKATTGDSINQIKNNDSSFSNDSKVNNDDLINSLQSIKNLILLDPYRAQIELENIILSL